MSASAIFVITIALILVALLPLLYWYAYNPRFWGPNRKRKRWEDEGE